MRAASFIRFAQSRELKPVGLSPFTPDSMRHIGIGWIQLIPRREREHLERRLQFVWFKKQDVFTVRMPAELGGRWGYRRILRKLLQFESFGPKFAQADISQGKWPAEVEFGDYHRQKQVLDYTITNTWGWNGRDMSLDFQTEYYLVWRWLRFQRSKIALREHIIRALNQFFAKEGLNSEIFITGMPTLQQSNELETRLFAGEIGFQEVLDQINT